MVVTWHRTFREMRGRCCCSASPIAMRATAHVAFPGLASAPRTASSRRGPVRVMANREQLNSATSQGLALSGSVMALNGGLAKFAVRDDVSVSRTEESGKTTVTIKARLPHHARPGPTTAGDGSQRAAQPAATASHPRAGVSPPPQAAPAAGVPQGWEAVLWACLTARCGCAPGSWALCRAVGPHTRAPVLPAASTATPVPVGGRTVGQLAWRRGGWQSLSGLCCGACPSCRPASDSSAHCATQVGTRNITDTNVAGGYLLPTVGPLADPAEAAAKAAALEEQLRLAKLEAEEAARRAKQLEVSRGSGDFGTRVALSPEALAKLAAEGGMTWAKDVDGLDASYSFYNIYRHGEPLEAVQSTADAAFSALAAWLKEQQAIVEQNFFIERDRLQRIAAADKAAALEALREELERVFQARLQVEVEKMRIQMEVEKQQALDKLRTEAALAQAQALARLEEQLNSRHAAELEGLKTRYEAQLDGLRSQMAALQERHAAELEAQRSAAAADKKAALERQKREYLSKYRTIKQQLADALELSIDGALTRIGQISTELEQYADAAERQEII